MAFRAWVDTLASNGKRANRHGRAIFFGPAISRMEVRSVTRPPLRAQGTAKGKSMQRETNPAEPIVSVQGLSKTYKSGFEALKRIDLDIRRGEILALLGPNGAGKTTLISIICGIVTPSAGTVLVDGHDIVRDYRAARAKIGLVPQEL